MSYLTPKEKIDVLFKLSEKIDRYWQMFIYTNFVVAVALGSTLISKSAAGQISVTFLGKVVPMTFIIQIFIVIFFSIFLFMNYRAVKDAYKGLDGIVKDLKIDMEKLNKESPASPTGFSDWTNSLNFSGRVGLARWIFIYSLVSVTTVIWVFAVHMSQFGQ